MKTAALLPGVTLQQHQRRIADEAAAGPIRKLLYHGLGSGKSLTSLAAMEGDDDPYAVVTPAALRENYRGESAKFTDRDEPAPVFSYQAAAKGGLPDVDKLVVDEAHRLREPSSDQTKAIVDAATRARTLLLLSGTPVVNRPGDLAVPLQLLTGKKLSPDEFEARYTATRPTYASLLHRMVGLSSGAEPVLRRKKELKALLAGHVDYYAPANPAVPVTYEDHAVDMGPEQVQLYRGMLDQLPRNLRRQLRASVDPEPQDLTRLMAFMAGPRQVGLSTLPFRRDKDSGRAYDQSPKLQAAVAKMTEHLSDERKKGLVFSNFVDAGLTPYAAALTRAGVPHGVFHGGLSDGDRKKLVDDYNAGRIRAALIGPSGTEGLSMKGTQLIQLLDPHWHPTRSAQAVGRGLRFDSHNDLPEDLRQVTVQRFASRLPNGVARRLARLTGTADPDVDRYVSGVADRKQQSNQLILDLLKGVGEKRGAVTYVPRSAVESVRRYGLLSGEKLRDEPEALAAAAAGRGTTPEEFGADISSVLAGRKPDSAKGPNILFRPPPGGLRLADGHPLRRHDMVPVLVALRRLLRDIPGTRVHGQELMPYSVYETEGVDDPSKRHRDLSAAELRRLSRTKQQDLWAGYDATTAGRMYAPDVPHAAVITPDGRIPAAYLRFLKGAATDYHVPPVADIGDLRAGSSVTPLPALLLAKTESDRKNYAAKHAILRRLLRERPGEFEVDDAGGRVVGLTHAPTGFRLHLPATALPTALPPSAPL